MKMHQKMVIFFKKTMKAYLKGIILLLKTYENILKFNFLIPPPPHPPPPIRHIDCLSKFFKAAINRCRGNVIL